MNFEFPHKPPKGCSYEFEQFNTRVIRIWLCNTRQFDYNLGASTKTVWGFYSPKKREYYAPINSKTIGKHPKHGYFALPGTSKNKVMFSSDADPWSFRRNKNELHLQVLKHPGIRKKIEKDGTLHEYI